MPLPASDPIVNIPLVTPFDAADRVDHEALAANVHKWLKTPATGFLVGSQSGEEWTLSLDEKLAITATVRENLDDRRFLIGGVDCPSVTETLRLADRLGEAGAEMLRIRFPRQKDQVRAYFEQLLPRCPLPVLLMHQNDPASFGIAAQPAAPPEVLAAITDMDNVFGYVTDHDVRFEARVRRRITTDRRFWICNGSLILHGTLMGCNGTTTAFSNIWPQAMFDLLTMGLEGDYQRAKELQRLVQEIDEVMLPWLAAGIKAALRLMGFEGMSPRAPTRDVPPEVTHRLSELLRAAGLIQ